MEAMTDVLNKIMNMVFYNHITGVFLWRKTITGKIKAGHICGSFKDGGRFVIRAGGKRFLAHRLAWAIVYGKWPDGEIDHIDGNPSNNAISNLRDVTKTINMQNRKRATSHNSSGLIGAHYHTKDKRWRARIVINGVSTYLGSFKTPEEASQKYIEAKRKYHDGCTI